MPMRQNLSNSLVTWITNPGDSRTTKGYPIIGDMQYISAFNKAGMYVPGILRMNPVVIQKSSCISRPSRPVNVKVGNYTSSCAGDIAAHAIVSSGWSVSPNVAMQIPALGANLSSTLNWDATMAAYSYNKALSKTYEPALDLGIVLGEMRETLTGLARPLSALNKFADKLSDGLANKIVRSFKGGRTRRKPVVTSADTLDMLTGSWLEWRYGITPLIILIEDAIKHFGNLQQVYNGKLCRAGGTTKRSYVRRNETAQYDTGWTFRGSLSTSVSIKTTTRVYWRQVLPPSFAQRYGLDLSNLPSVAWELVPLSFVVDWFIGVGDWIGSLKGLDNIQVYGTCTSQKTTVEVGCDVHEIFYGYYPNGKSSCQTSSAKLTFERLERRVNITPPQIPAVNLGALSLKRQIDALSLIWQRMPRLRS